MWPRWRVRHALPSHSSDHPVVYGTGEEVWKRPMFQGWDFDNCRCLFPWKRESEPEKEPVSSALGAPDSEGERNDCTPLSGRLWTFSTVG